MIRKIITLLICFLAFSCAGIPDRSGYIESNPDSLNFEGLQYGICHAGYSRSEREYNLLEQLGVNWVRIDFSWNKMEEEEGIWDFSRYDNYMEKAEKEGMNVLAILNYDTKWLHKNRKGNRRIEESELPEFLTYVETVAERYGSRVGAFEIWNEPNTNRFWTKSDESFFDLTNLTLKLLKAVTPETPVAVGSLFYHPILRAESYLKKMIKSGVLELADAVSLHPYGISLPSIEARILEARELIFSMGYDTPIWITETGFPTGGTYPNRVSLDKHGEVLTETVVRLSATGAEMIIWYSLFDSLNPDELEPGKSSEAFFGLAYPDYKAYPGGLAYSLGPDFDPEGFKWPEYTLKPGASSFSILTKELQGSSFIPQVFRFSDYQNRSVYQALFVKEDGSNILILWSHSPIEIDLTPIGSPVLEILNILKEETLFLPDSNKIIITEEPLLLRF